MSYCVTYYSAYNAYGCFLIVFICTFLNINLYYFFSPYSATTSHLYVPNILQYLTYWFEWLECYRIIHDFEHKGVAKFNKIIFIFNIIWRDVWKPCLFIYAYQRVYRQVRSVNKKLGVLLFQVAALRKHHTPNLDNQLTYIATASYLSRQFHV